MLLEDWESEEVIATAVGNVYLCEGLVPDRFLDPVSKLEGTVNSNWSINKNGGVGTVNQCECCGGERET
jgi:hypothetical protein